MLCEIPVKEFEKLASLKIRYLSLDQVELPDEAYAVIPTIHGLEELCVTPNSPGNVALSYVAQCQELQKLYLHYSSIDDSSVIHVTRIRKLRKLDLTGTGVTRIPESFKSLASLTTLNLEKTTIGDDSVTTLTDCASLDHLSLSDTLVTDDGVETICKKLRLRKFLLGGPGVTDRCLPSVAEMETLRSLSLLTTSVTGKATELLCRLKNLELLMLPSKPFSRRQRAKLKSSLCTCQVHWFDD